MTRLQWNAPGERLFQAGIDRGVLYPKGRSGVPWNGLVSVKETPVGGTATPYYIDGVKYLNRSTAEELEGTIEAFTYPEEFAECDGTMDIGALSFFHQERKPFDFSYRSRIGNDLENIDHGYRIHLIYNALAQPTSVSNNTIGNVAQPKLFNWKFTTLPLYVTLPNGKKILGSHIAIDSRRATLTQLRGVEEALYGNSTKPARLPSMGELIDIIEGNYSAVIFGPEFDTGTNRLTPTQDGRGDLIGPMAVGIYETVDETRLRKTNFPGINTLE